jgi:hypothetical protein
MTEINLAQPRNRNREKRTANPNFKLILVLVKSIEYK